MERVCSRPNAGLHRQPEPDDVRASSSSDRDAPPWFHLVEARRPLAFLVEHSQLFEIDAEFCRDLRACDPEAIADLHALRGALPDVEVPLSPPLSLSLNVVQACNLACHYCYADEGRFQGKARRMSDEVALTAIDRLMAGSGGRRVTIGFIGGEPFLNRELVHKCIAHARARAAALHVPVAFSVATNATLLRDEDLALLRDNEFAVSVSLDGNAEVHDRHRPQRDGGGSHAHALAAITPLLADPGRARVVARVTVTRDDLRVAERIAPLADAGFLEVGVSPARTGPNPSLLLRAEDWLPFLEQMIRAAQLELDEFRRRGCIGALRFSNLAIALKEIHRGAAKNLPCGAAQSYLSVSADGGYYTCHRTIGQKSFALGDLETGPAEAFRRSFLARRQVDRQEPCRTCWARYLCGGGCHAEVNVAGRAGCDFIRGWLEFCLVAYNEARDEFPNLFSPGASR
jgi:uncharacterized protein